MDRSKTLEQRAMSWCFENDYKVDVLPTRQGKRPPVKLNVLKGGKIIKKGTIDHLQNNKLAEKIQNIYVHLFEHFRN